MREKFLQNRQICIYFHIALSLYPLSIYCFVVLKFAILRTLRILLNKEPLYNNIQFTQYLYYDQLLYYDKITTNSRTDQNFTCIAATALSSKILLCNQVSGQSFYLWIMQLNSRLCINKFLVRLHGAYNILVKLCVLLALMKIRAYGSKALQ